MDPPPNTLPEEEETKREKQARWDGRKAKSVSETEIGFRRGLKRRLHAGKDDWWEFKCATSQGNRSRKATLLWASLCTWVTGVEKASSFPKEREEKPVSDLHLPSCRCSFAFGWFSLGLSPFTKKKKKKARWDWVWLWKKRAVRRRIKGKERMSTLTVPPVLTSPRDDAMQLYRAFKGTSPLSLYFSLSSWLTCFAMKRVVISVPTTKCCYPLFYFQLLLRFALCSFRSYWTSCRLFCNLTKESSSGWHALSFWELGFTHSFVLLVVWGQILAFRHIDAYSSFILACWLAW